jgi:hypothetical protein
VATTEVNAARSDLDLLALSGRDLDDLYRCGTVGSIPRGTGKGTAVLIPGRRAARVLAKITWLTAWQGKVFDEDGTKLVNLVSPLRRRAVKAQVYEGDSWLDRDRCIVIDYSKTSRIARWVRDEIREVAPDMFVGLVYVGRRRLPLRFVLDFRGR